MAQLVFRFFVGGLVVSLFAALGDVLKPKSFAGLFGAAPSVALATLSLTVSSEGKDYASTEARSMIVGAGAFSNSREDRKAAMRFAFRNAGVDCVTVGYKNRAEVDEAIENINLAFA